MGQSVKKMFSEHF